MNSRFRKTDSRRRAPIPVPLFWIALRSAVKLLPGSQPDHIFTHLVPKFNPGSGIVRGRHNIVKAVTYRATYTGFNQARDARRAARLANDGVFI